MIRHNRLRSVKPKVRDLSQDFTFARNPVGHDAIERRDAVGRHEQQVIAELKYLAHLAAFEFPNPGQFEAEQTVVGHAATMERAP